MSPNTRRRPTAEAHKHHRAASVSLAFALVFMLVAVPGLTRVAPAQGPALDFEALALEVTQGIQNLNNTVRLIAGKTTFIRFYVRTNGEAAAVSALLRVSGLAGTVDLPPINSGGAIFAVPAPDRRRADAAFLFAVPTALTAPGNVSFQALVNPGGQVPEACAANNLLTIPSLTFEAVPTLNLVIYNLAYTVNGTTHIAPDSDPAQMVNWMMRTWPVSDIQFRILRDHAGNALPTCDQVNRFPRH